MKLNFSGFYQRLPLVCGLAAIGVLATSLADAKSCPKELSCETLHYHFQIAEGKDIDVEVEHMQRVDAVSPGTAGRFSLYEPGAVLAVHGMVHNGKFFKPLSKEVLRRYPAVKDFFSLAYLPGHVAAGGISGDYNLTDYANALIMTVEKLNGENGGVKTLLGHSMGGLIIQLAEETLNNRTPSRRLNSLGIHNIILLAPSMPGDIEWGVPALLAAKLPPYITADAAGHLVISLPNADWLGFFYANASGVVAGAPDFVTEVPTINTLEPLTGVLQLGGIGMPRLTVKKGLFNGYNVAVVGFDADIYASPTELDNLINHLVTTTSTLVPAPARIQVSVPGATGEEAVHGTPFSDSVRTAGALETVLR